MNIIIISPNFPACNVHFCTRLQAAGVHVLGIGDGFEDQFGSELRYGLTEYYHVDDLSDYEAVYRACAYFIYRYGRIDRIESFNPYWLETEVRLRKEFRVAGRQKPPAKKTGSDPIYTLTALLGEGKRSVASVAVALLGDELSLTRHPLDPALQELWERTLVSLGEENEFFTASFVKSKDGGFQLAETYPAPAPLSTDLINYTCDCDVYALWAQGAVGKPTSRTFEPLYACAAIRTDFSREYPALAALPEISLVQETPVEQVFANTWGGSVLVYRFQDQQAAADALRAALPAVEKKTNPAKPKRAPGKRGRPAKKAEKPPVAPEGEDKPSPAAKKAEGQKPKAE